MSAVTVRQLLTHARAQLESAGVENARMDAELLLRHILRWDRAQLLTRMDEVVDATHVEAYTRAVASRAMRVPLQYITGEQEFFGLAFAVSPAVLVPRPETELLVEAALQRIPHEARVRIADVGTGSGAIAVALAHSRPHIRVAATDISRDALAVAAQNAERHNVTSRIEFIHADLLDGADGEFNIIASNPPYVAEAERDALAPEVRDHEPGSALFAGADGLAMYRRLIPSAHDRLRTSGTLLLEIGAGQSAAVREMLSGWDNVEVLNDLNSIPRAVIARKS